MKLKDLLKLINEEQCIDLFPCAAECQKGFIESYCNDELLNSNVTCIEADRSNLKVWLDD